MFGIKYNYEYPNQMTSVFMSDATILAGYLTPTKDLIDVDEDPFQDEGHQMYVDMAKNSEELSNSNSEIYSEGLFFFKKPICEQKYVWTSSKSQVMMMEVMVLTRSSFRWFKKQQISVRTFCYLLNGWNFSMVKFQLCCQFFYRRKDDKY